MNPLSIESVAEENKPRLWCAGGKELLKALGKICTGSEASVSRDLCEVAFPSNLIQFSVSIARI